MVQRKFAVWGFVAAGALSAVAAVEPLLDGGRLNATFLLLAVVWFVLAASMAKKNRAAAPPSVE